MTAPEPVQTQGEQFACEMDAHIAESMKDPEFREAFEDTNERHRVLDGLLAQRRERGLTQTNVAEYIGITQPTVSEFEAESSDPRISTLMRYARAVGMRLTVTLNQTNEGDSDADRATEPGRIVESSGADSLDGVEGEVGEPTASARVEADSELPGVVGRAGSREVAPPVQTQETLAGLLARHRGGYTTGPYRADDGWRCACGVILLVDADAPQALVAWEAHVEAAARLAGWVSPADHARALTEAWDQGWASGTMYGYDEQRYPNPFRKGDADD